MIKRDAYGIIIQHDPEQPEYADGGDSASRTGIMAFSGSGMDQFNMGLFIMANELVRHPYQDQWNDSTKTSRDQLVTYAAGATFLHRSVIKSYANGWFINKDLLDPAVRLYLYTCAAARPPAYLEVLGRAWLFLAILFNCYIKPNEEMNQIACVCAKMGRGWLRLLVKLHPGLYMNITQYWGGWRDQHDLGVAFICKLADIVAKE